jgi:hypothetical protein
MMTYSRSYTVNPQRVLQGLLSDLEGDFSRKELHYDVETCEQSSKTMDLKAAQNGLSELLERMALVSLPGSTLFMTWQHGPEGLSLRVSPNPRPMPGRVPMPFLTYSSPILQSLEESGIQVLSEDYHGPWTVLFKNDAQG